MSWGAEGILAQGPYFQVHDQYSWTQTSGSQRFPPSHQFARKTKGLKRGAVKIATFDAITITVSVTFQIPMYYADT